jgi:uncharacterized protein
MASPVVLDAGPLVAILNRDDEFHRWAVAQLNEIHGEIITCETVISETYFLTRHIPGAVSALLSLLDARVVVLRFDLAANLSVIAALIRKYHDVPMSLADACLVRMAELHDGARVFTLDSDFAIYRRHGRQTIPLIYPAP